MKISTRGRYALRVMVDIAQNSKGNFVSLKEISKRQEISMKYLEQIVAILSKVGYLETMRGNSGGYRLKKKEEDYVIGDILRTVEKDLSPVICVKENNMCKRQHICKTYSFWKGLDNVISNYVDSKTLKDII